MNGWEFFQIYSPIKTHFTTKYDIFKYHGKTKHFTHAQYEKLRGRGIYEMFATSCVSKRTAGKLVLANCAYRNNPNWIFEGKREAQECLIEWEKVQQSPLAVFTHDLKVINETTNSMSWDEITNNTRAGRLPPLLQLVVSNRIHSETVIILDHFRNIIDTWRDNIFGDPVGVDGVNKLCKYRPFISKQWSTDFQQRLEASIK